MEWIARIATLAFGSGKTPGPSQATGCCRRQWCQTQCEADRLKLASRTSKEESSRNLGRTFKG